MALIVGGTLLAVSLAVAPSPLVAETGAPCGDGITVVVDQPDQAEPRVGCAALAAASAGEALEAAGFAIGHRPGFPGMICQIDGYPDPCNGAPADAYWSLWTWEGDEWVYSRWGAADTQLAEGDVEGWAFGSGAPPRLDADNLAVAQSRPVDARRNSWWGVVVGGVLVGAAGCGAVWQNRRRRE